MTPSLGALGEFLKKSLLLGFLTAHFFGENARQFRMEILLKKWKNGNLEWKRTI